MNYILVAVSSFLLNGLSILASKFLLSNKNSHPVSYVFYISAGSLLALVALPWTHLPTTNTIILASLSTLAWTAGVYFMFSALKIGLADRVSPLIGVLLPVFLMAYYFIFTHSISLNEVWGSLIAVCGLLVLIYDYLFSKLDHRGEVNRTAEIICELLAAFLFAISYILLKEVYNQTDFLSGLVYSKFILIPTCLAILIIPKLKSLVFASKGDSINFLSPRGFLFIGSQITGGASQVLLSLAISLANPALVNSLQGVQYIFLFIASLILGQYFPQVFTERFNRKLFLQKIAGVVLIGLGLYILAFANSSPQKTRLAITFSPRYASELGLNPKVTYISLLDDLNPPNVRIPIYWDEVEKDKGKYDFSEGDYYVREAQRRNIKLTLVIGYKVPRFPECFIPSWANNLSGEGFNSDLYNYLRQVTYHYKDQPNLEIWQVENEPLFPFGFCPNADISRLRQEVENVRGVDPNHPIMITESGEYGLWLTTARIGDYVGTTLYRRQFAAVIPWFKSPLPPFFYQFKGMIVHLFYPDKKLYVAELQAEPWANSPIQQTSYDYQKTAFPVGDLQDNVNFSKEAGFDTIYLWGSEWWYWLKSQGHPEYLNAAIKIFLGAT